MGSQYDSRPDPDQLLAGIHNEDAMHRHGRLRIYFGASASAGVGKTYAMLSAAQR